MAAGSPNRIRPIEGGVLDYGSDMTPAENPLELALGRLIDFSKPEFTGKAALERIRDRGTPRKMVGVFMSGEAFQANDEHRFERSSSPRSGPTSDGVVEGPSVDGKRTGAS